MKEYRKADKFDFNSQNSPPTAFAPELAGLVEFRQNMQCVTTIIDNAVYNDPELAVVEETTLATGNGTDAGNTTVEGGEVAGNGTDGNSTAAEAGGADNSTRRRRDASSCAALLTAATALAAASDTRQELVAGLTANQAAVAALLTSNTVETRDCVGSSSAAQLTALAEEMRTKLLLDQRLVMEEIDFNIKRSRSIKYCDEIAECVVTTTSTTTTPAPNTTAAPTTTAPAGVNTTVAATTTVAVVGNTTTVTGNSSSAAGSNITATTRHQTDTSMR